MTNWYSLLHPPFRRRARGRPQPAPRLDRAERRELPDLPARIEALEAELAAMHEQMADPGYFRQEGERIAEGKARLAALEAEIQIAYERWEALEAKRTGGGVEGG